LNNRRISFSRLARLKLLRKKRVGFFVVSGDNYSRRVFIKTMNNAGTHVVCFRVAYFPASVKPSEVQRVGKGVLVVARSRMDYHSLRFVYDNAIIIFINYFKRNILRDNIHGRGILPAQFKKVSLFYRAGIFYGFSVYFRG